jgi:hypothetical protein
VFREAEDGISAEIIALDAQRERVDIALGALPGSRTKLCIQVGFGGDRDKSIVLFESIVAKSSRQGWVTAVPPAPQSAQGGGSPGER